jgi:hypothetical protein
VVRLDPLCMEITGEFDNQGVAVKADIVGRWEHWKRARCQSASLMEETDARAPESLGTSLGIRGRRIQQVVHKEISTDEEKIWCFCGSKQRNPCGFIDWGEILVELLIITPLFSMGYEHLTPKESSEMHHCWGAKKGFGLSVLRTCSSQVINKLSTELPHIPLNSRYGREM